MTKNLPKAPPLRKLIGPSFILLGLGLGSGELILWPYLTSKYGLGLIWAAVIGITFQYFINTEIARFTLLENKSIFLGFREKFGYWTPIWFVFSTFIPWMWPGIISSSGVLFASLFNFKNPSLLTILLLLIIGLIYSAGTVIYKTQEGLHKMIIYLGVPFIFWLTFFLAKPTDWQALGNGLMGISSGYRFIPPGLALASFLGAMAYAGAGGNLNLAHSYYVKEKGYCLGKYSRNISVFRDWWKKINFEHALVFWLTGAMSIVLLSLLAYIVTHGKNPEPGIMFILEEAQFISQSASQFIGKIFLGTVGLLLFGTQFAVFGSTSRIMAENSLLTLRREPNAENRSRLFSVFIWLQIVAAIVIILSGFTEPLSLVTLAAVLNAFTMFVYTGLLLLINRRKHEPEFSLSPVRKIVVGSAFLFYGIFSFLTLVKYLS